MCTFATQLCYIMLQAPSSCQESSVASVIASVVAAFTTAYNGFVASQTVVVAAWPAGPYKLAYRGASSGTVHTCGVVVILKGNRGADDDGVTVALLLS